MNHSDEIQMLLTAGNVGYFSYCKIDQVVLLNKNDRTITNFFTHIHISEKYQSAQPFNFVTDKPISINNNYSLAISTMIVDIKTFLAIYLNAIENQVWEFDGIKVNLDDVFVTPKKYIPANDPTGGQYGLNVALENALYGSNFIGNYYVHELFSKKATLSGLAAKEKTKIAFLMKQHKLNYDLEKLHDRIGNVICKLDSEIIEVTPRKLGDINGIELDYKVDARPSPLPQIIIQVFQTHDGMVYNNSVTNCSPTGKIALEPNQMQTRISMTVVETGLLAFYGIYDYSRRSNYKSQITPPLVCATAERAVRKMHLCDNLIEVPISNVQMVGEVYSFIEMEQAALRQQVHEDVFFTEAKYFLCYGVGQHQKAIQDIRAIINGILLWDLDEICIIDPYLTATEILETALYVQRKNINIKALCDFDALHGNPDTKVVSCAQSYETFKENSKQTLDDALVDVTDISLEFRSVYDNHGAKFHDRFLILKYQLNKLRVWSLGASLNSIGSKHSIVQIVETPETIYGLFNELWGATNWDICKIYNREKTEVQAP